MILIANDLHEAVRSAMLEPKTPTFDKRRRVASLVAEALMEAGEFFRAADGRGFYFSKPERRLYPIEQQPFRHLLTNFAGLSSTESTFAFVHDVLQAHTARVARLVQVHTLAHFDAATGLLVVSDGAGGAWMRERRGAWTPTHNGDNGILFYTEPDGATWVPEFPGKPEALVWFLGGFQFADGALGRQDQQALLLMWLVHQFFPAMRRTRIVPALLGPQGAGKTSGLRRLGGLLVGPEFDVTGLHRDREDAFLAAVTNRVVCAFDNADSRVPWLDDALATYATGLRYRLRRLYTTNEEVSYEPRAILLLSSRDPHFNRPDVAERLLPLYFERPPHYMPEGQLCRELQARRGAIWGALLERLGLVVDQLADAVTPPLRFRMADFAVFGWRVSALVGQAAEWEGLLQRLEGVQATFASEGDGVVEALRLLVERDGSVGPIAVAELFRQCRALAESEGLPFPKSAQGFGRRLSILRRVLELELRVKVKEERGHERKRWITLLPRNGDGGDVGEPWRRCTGTSFQFRRR